MKLPSRRTLLGIIALAALVYVGMMILESRKPLLPPVRERKNHPAGYSLVSMVVDLVDAQLEGFGGWTPNDLPLTPGYWLDNLPSFQLGVLSVVQRVTVTLRDDLGRGKPTEQPHPELAQAATAYSADLKRWANPSAESMLERGNDALIRFRQGLDTGSTTHAQIYTRAESLVRLVDSMVEELRVVNERLLKASDRDAVPWYKVDDNLYSAQGVAYALQGLLLAAKSDFPALQQGKAQAALDAAILNLEESQFEPWVVTNGTKSSLLANHSSRLRSFLEEVRLSLVAVSAALKAGG